VVFVPLALTSDQSTADAKVIRVPADAPTIQAGIDIAVPGDEVVVAQGRHVGQGNKNLDLQQKDIVVRSEDGAELTVIDCEGSGRGFILFGNTLPSTRIEGFKIENGNGNEELLGGGGMVIGGGAPTIRSCIFRHNIATSASLSGGGGGLVCHGSSALIEDCEFIQNSVVPNGLAVGGGLASHEGSPTIRGCRFVENVAMGGGGGGGGLYVHLIAPTPGVIIEDCEFYRNRAWDGGAGIASGSHVSNCRVEANEGSSGVGGVAILFSQMEECLIVENTSENFGGGVSLDGSTMTDCVIVRNRAVRGGGIWAHNGSTIERCVSIDNEAQIGGGLYINTAPSTSVMRCTFVRNGAKEGSGIAARANGPIVHHVEGSIVSHGIGGSAIACLGGATFEVSCSDLFGTEGGDWVGCLANQEGVNGNFAADPMFCGENMNVFTLAANSPCLPGNHPQGANCGIMGAEEKGCSASAVQATTWGQIKARGLQSRAH
jgi:hypothetical protein